MLRSSLRLYLLGCSDYETMSASESVEDFWTSSSWSSFIRRSSARISSLNWGC